MMKPINLILLCIFLTACSTQHRIVYVPTPVKCPEPIIKPEPDYPVKHLTEADKHRYGKVAKAYAVSYKMCLREVSFYKTQAGGHKGG